MTKKELTQKIKANAKEQIKIYKEEIKNWSDEEMEFNLKGAIQGIKEFVVNLQKIGVIA